MLVSTTHNQIDHSKTTCWHGWWCSYPPLPPALAAPCSAPLLQSNPTNHQVYIYDTGIDMSAVRGLHANPCTSKRLLSCSYGVALFCEKICFSSTAGLLLVRNNIPKCTSCLVQQAVVHETTSHKTGSQSPPRPPPRLFTACCLIVAKHKKYKISKYCCVRSYNCRHFTKCKFCSNTRSSYYGR